ncbi:MAG TPA: hypothetical protein DIU20_09930, partial [Cryomorphaceae bacterium]|nr:hypothetical protein [Cryomorphaceae bacterium]
MQEQLSNSEENNEGSDLRYYLFKIVSIWPYIIICIALALSIAFIYNRYSKEIYRATVILLIESENTSSLSNVMEAIGYYNPRLTFENEVVIIKSLAMAERTIQHTDFGVEYWTEGRVRVTELYDKSPIELVMDSTHVQAINYDIVVADNGKGGYEVSIMNLDQSPSLYNYEEFKYEEINIGKAAGNIDATVNLKDGEWYTTPYHSFKIVRKNDDPFNELTIKLKSVQSIATQWQKRLEVEPTAKGSSAVDITSTAENPEKVRVYLNELVQQYLDFGLFVKNEIAKNTLEFVSSELNRVGDTLRAIETNLADFRSDKMILDVSMKAQKYYEQITELERQLTSLEIERNYINYIEDYLRGDQFQDDPVIPMTLGDGTSQKIIDQLAELESRKASLGITASEANPVLKNMNEQIGYLKSRLREAMKGVEERNSARIAKLQKELRNLESNLSELPEQ